MSSLRFPLEGVAPLALHAMSASEHAPTISEQMDDVVPRAALHWVADDGTYLMSNGLPGLIADGNRPVVVYAEGWESGSDRWELAQLVGHDDFVEKLPLAGLASKIAAALIAGRRWFVVIVEGETMQVGFER